jgi:hypothetical protein
VTCHDARPQLSALLDDALSVAEHQALEAHLAGCAECRRELEQLRGTVALLGRLPPAHAPAGFVDRVMDAAYRPPWWRRMLDTLFRPLRVKLPLEAAAALLVGVSALYVYQHAPEVQDLARQESPVPGPASPAAPSQPPAPVTGAAEEAPRSKSAERQATRAPAAPPAPRDKAVPATPPAAAPPATPAPPVPAVPRQNTMAAPAAETDAKPPAELRSEVQSELKAVAKPETKPEAKPETKPEAKPETKKEAVTARPDTSGPAPAPGKVETFARSAEPSAPRDTAGSRAPSGPAPAAPAPQPGVSASPPEARGRAGGLGSAPPAAPGRESAAGDTAATAKSRSAARLMRASDASGRLTVPARDPAEAELDALLRRLGGARVARRLEGAPGLLLIDVVVPAARYRELVEGLGKIGRWTPEYESTTLPPEVRVEIAVSAAP